jgi:hypothetical protein
LRKTLQRKPELIAKLKKEKKLTKEELELLKELEKEKNGES